MHTLHYILRVTINIGLVTCRNMHCNDANKLLILQKKKYCLILMNKIYSDEIKIK